uniref:DUF4806 domain-containing protein n=2 Tax=Schistocephalus solidus TaxID=70667 RepID=A0A0X3NJ80_SCHSO
MSILVLDASVSNSQSEFQEEMYRRLNILAKRQLQMQATQRRILTKLPTVELTQPTTSTAPIQMGIEIPVNPVAQPIASRAAFRDLDEWLLDPNFRRELESYLLCLGCQNTDDFIKRIFYAIFDDDIALELNFQGRKVQDALSGSTFY